MSCIRCGGYAWAGVASLANKCPGHLPTKDLRRQRTRFAKGDVPSWARQYKGWSVTGHRSPTPLDLVSLVRAAHKRGPALRGG
eukprot:2400763-Pyramimonas_sp.AAC.1